MTSVVELRPALGCDDIVTALRGIADEVEAGAYSFTPTTAVVVLGLETERRDRRGITNGYQWQTHGLGKTSFFTAKGLLAAALNQFDDSLP